MKLIVGLGNIGKNYDNTRHNVGFYILDLLSKNFDDKFTSVSKLKSLVLKTGNLVLIKPTTFMNLSGESVRAVVDFYKIEASDILVVHDDIDQPVGSFKLVESGGAGGHKGVLSIYQHLNITDQKIRRLKIGVAPEIYSPSLHKAEDFVLQKFNKSEIELVGKVYIQSLEHVLLDNVCS